MQRAVGISKQIAGACQILRATPSSTCNYKVVALAHPGAHAMTALPRCPDLLDYVANSALCTLLATCIAALRATPCIERSRSPELITVACSETAG